MSSSARPLSNHRAYSRVAWNLGDDPRCTLAAKVDSDPGHMRVVRNPAGIDILDRPARRVIANSIVLYGLPLIAP